MQAIEERQRLVEDLRANLGTVNTLAQPTGVIISPKFITKNCHAARGVPDPGLASSTSPAPAPAGLETWGPTYRARQLMFQNETSIPRLHDCVPWESEAPGQL